jgi:radical SAM/Cys-rich protein
LDTLQVNLGYRCNQRCLHCHVAAGPDRSEVMDAETLELLLDVLEHSGCGRLDLTGGAPELNPGFRDLVVRARGLGVRVMDRCNLTILGEPGQEGLADFLAANQVHVVASLPCYLEENVDGQRGKGVFSESIAGLRALNGAGYGAAGLPLDLVYNPTGPMLPPSQFSLEADYRRELGERYGVSFTRLLTIANMPIKRFGSQLLSRGELEGYLDLLRSSHDADNLDTVMCRGMVSVDWEGFLYDCDFNQMLNLPARLAGRERPHLRDLLEAQVTGEQIRVAEHCFGCTAGQGSSCGGALKE